MWTDANGQSQPRPTLFVGLMRSNNPYLGQLEGTFKDLAGELRKGTCNECHAPDNSVGMKRLVLMQTPAHAAGEIKRIMRAVREDKMPLDDVGLYKGDGPRHQGGAAPVWRRLRGGGRRRARLGSQEPVMARDP